MDIKQIQVAGTTYELKDTVARQGIIDLSAQKADKVQEAWIAPTLVNGWVQMGGYRVGYYKNSMGDVFLSGAVDLGAASTVLFTLPVGYRPSADRLFSIYGNGLDSSKVLINRWGEVKCLFMNLSVGLDGIIFRGEQ